MILSVISPTFETLGIIDDAKSTIWHSSFFSVGDFEIYAMATEKHLALLQPNFYVARDDDIGIIEAVDVKYTAAEGYMLTATGRGIKSILDRRLIYNLSGHTNTPTILRGNVERAVRSLIFNNAISAADARRNISILSLGALKGFPEVIVDGDGNAAEKQVSYQNLLTYSDEILKSYGMGAKLVRSGDGFLYEIVKGADRSTDNTDGNHPIIFSKGYDNLTSSDYKYDETTKKNIALIGGAGQDIERFYIVYGESASDLARREVFVNASSINRTYKDGDEQKTYSDAEYSELLRQYGKTAISSQNATETFKGDVNVTYGNWIINRDYYLGDIVTVQDNMLGKYINARITDVIEVWDENGYLVNVKLS